MASSTYGRKRRVVLLNGEGRKNSGERDKLISRQRWVGMELFEGKKDVWNVEQIMEWFFKNKEKYRYTDEEWNDSTDLGKGWWNFPIFGNARRERNKEFGDWQVNSGNTMYL
jgi:hypothetical protein